MADPTQADRDAAADLYRHLFPDNDIRAANIQLGNIDDGYAVQAFALHAQQAREQALEEARQLAWKMAGKQMPAYAVADAIRALKEQHQ